MPLPYPLPHPLTDDDGDLLLGASVSVASVKDADDRDVPGHGASCRVSGPNVLIDYDPETHGEAWVTLRVSKPGAPVTGDRASPSVWISRDSGRLNASLTASGAVLAPTLKAAANLPPGPPPLVVAADPRGLFFVVQSGPHLVSAFGARSGRPADAAPGELGFDLARGWWGRRFLATDGSVRVYSATI